MTAEQRHRPIRIHSARALPAIQQCGQLDRTTDGWKKRT